VRHQMTAGKVDDDRRRRVDSRSGPVGRDEKQIWKVEDMARYINTHLP
jgi:hypothetical protein